MPSAVENPRSEASRKNRVALADSPNLHEAEAAMNEARRLMLAHNIDATATAATDGYR